MEAHLATTPPLQGFGRCRKKRRDAGQEACTPVMEERMEQSKFQSWEDLCVFLDVWCEEKKMKFNILQSEALTEEDIQKYPGGTERAWALKYSSLHLGCSSCTSKSCPASIQLKLCPDEDRLIIASANLLHNHNLPDTDVPLQVKRSRVTYPARLPAQMANDISWKFLESCDLKKLLGLRCAVFEERTHVLKELESLFRSDPDIKAKLVFLEGKLLIKSLFLMTSQMQHIAQKFPGYLFVDCISSFSPGFDFYTVFCETEGLAWKVCANCFVKKGSADTLRFIVVSILQSSPTMKSQVKQIMVNPEISDILDLQILIPHATVRYCRPLILEILYRKVSHLDTTAKAHVKNILHILVHTLSPKDYDRYLTELKTVSPAEVFQYYQEVWHPRRKLWMEKDVRTEVAEHSIQSSVNATHRALLDQLGSTPTLHHCLQVVLSDNRAVLSTTESSQELSSRTYMTPLVMIKTDEAAASPEDDEKIKNLFQFPGECNSNENQISEEALDEPLEQSEFHSWCDFCAFLDTWCLKKKMAFNIRQSVSLKNDHVNPDPQWPDLANALKYSSVIMGCSVSKNCPAVMNLKLGPQNNKLILTKAVLRHNHDDLGTNIPPPVTRSRLAPLMCQPTKITNDVSKRFLERSDLIKLQKLHPAPFEDWAQFLNHLDALFVSNPGAKVKLVFMENRLLVKNVFIMTSYMLEVVQRFPGFLYVDFLPRFGSLFDLYTVYCEDDNSEWRVCAKCIARKSRSSNLRFLMVSILQSIENLTNQVKYVTVNPEIQDPLDLEPLVPFASLRYCMPLVLEILYEKISHFGSTAEVQIKNFLHILAHTCSPSVYGRYLSELKGACPAEFFHYYYETWHPHRKMWIKKDNRSQIAESNICTLVKSEHQSLRAHIDSSSSLYHCLQVILDGNMMALDATSPSLLQTSPAMLETSPTYAARQAPESTREDELDQTAFSSWEDFCSFLDAWCEERKLMFTVRQSATLTEEEISQCPSGAVLAQCLKYSLVLLFCTRNSCPAFIKLQLCSQKEKLIISDTSFEHNHDLPETDFAPPLKRSKLASAVGLPVQIANNISRKFLEPNDLNTLQRFRSGAFEDRSQVLRELISLLLSDPDAKVKLVFEENKLQVKNIFLMTSSMQQIARCFPRYLYIDFLSGFSPGFDLYSVLCEEENLGWTACAYCIARKRTSDNLKFIVVSIFQSIPILNSQVKHVTVNPEIQDPLDIEDLVPCASLRYCMPLVLDLLYNKISEMNSEEEAQIKDFFHILAHTHSPAVYNQALNELKAACPAEVFQYYYETWHPCRKLWAEEYNSASDTESSISAYVKLKHQALAAQMGTLPSLHRCLRVVLDDSKTTLRITDFSQAHPSGPAISPAVVQQADAAPVEERMKQNKFGSWEDLCIFLDTWCKENKVELSLHRSEALTAEDIHQYPGGAERARDLKYSSVQLNCSSCISKSCPAFIQLKLSPEEDKLIVADINLHHNHNWWGMDIPLQIKRSRGKHPQRSPASIANDISSKFLEPSDLKELLSLRSAVFEERTHVLKELDSLFVSDPNTKVKLVFFEDKLLIKSIFLMLSNMQDVALKTPRHLFVDFISSFVPGYDFYTVFCEEKGLAWKACAWCFARKGTADNLRFIMVSIFQSIPTLKIQVKQIMVNPEIRDALDLEVFIPRASVRYCMPLVLDILCQKVSHLDSSTKDQVKNILHIMAHTPSLKIYNRYLDELKTICPTEIFQYYLETWHPCRNMWMKKDDRTQDAERSIGVSLHTTHQTLLDQVGCPPSLHHGLQVVLSNSKPLLAITEPSQELSSKSHMTSSDVKEKSALVKKRTLSSWISDCIELCYQREQDQRARKLTAYRLRAATATKKDEVTISPEEDEKPESPFQLSGESRPSENQVSEEYMEERLEQSEFHSWEDFHSYLDTWCLKNKMRFAIRQLVPLKNEHLSPDPQWSELAKSLKYNSVIMGCSASKTCPAVISLKLNSQKDKLILDKTMLCHNHNILEDNLPPPVTRSRLSALPCFPAKITNDISRKFLERNDLVKLQRFHPAQFEDRIHILNELDALLISDPGVKVKLVFMENRLLMRNIFIMTSHMQETIQQFPEYLYVDLLSHFGSHVDLYTVYCEDKNSEWKVCAMCIAQKGMSANVRFLMISVLQSIQNLSTQVKYVTMNPDIREPLDMKSLIPFASLRYCMPLVLEMLYEKISYLGSIAEAKIKNILHNLTDTCSPIVYNQYLKKLKAACPLEFFYYYYGTWHPHRKMWLQKDNRTQIAENNICTIIKSKHQALRAQAESSSSLYHCLQVVLNDSLIALNATSSPHMQELPSVLETFPTNTPEQACESTKEEELAQTEFSSWVDFCLFLDSWCEERKLLFTVRQWRTLTKEEISQCPSGPVLAQCLKYSMVQLFCTRKNCPAFIKLQLCPQKEKLIVANSSFLHNHDLPETDFAPPLKRSKLMSTVGLPVQIANNISRKFLKPYDLNTLQRFLSGAFEDRSQVLKKLDSLFFSDPDAKVKLVFEENKLQVKDIFLMTSSMQQIARCFPRYLYVDFLSGFSPSFDLYSVLCEEENVGWVACAYCIAKKGTSDNLKFIVVSIFQSIPILNSQVKHVTVNPEIQDPLDIEDLVPCASLRYCMPLVLDLLYNKISEMNSEEEAQIKDFFHILAHTHSPAVYNQALNELKAACPAEVFQYYYETWHPRRKLWAEEYNSTPDAESSVSAYVKAKHQVLTSQMGTLPSLHRCLRVILNDSKTILPITDPSSGYPEPAVSPAVIKQKMDVPAASLDEEEMEKRSPKRYNDSYVPNSQVSEALVEKQLERNEFHSWQDFLLLPGRLVRGDGS
uniref:Uncharacterized protein LOC117367517 isoform X2 n=1 Tax=Geotrypetes seraphini TaxID=260995 RepID=A0A6P8SBJ7_GEOSA|nr:uncharacterized protein LOC117367517 isoform X2 [Geotrypetes seraphini]